MPVSRKATVRGNGWEMPPGGGIVAGDYNDNGKVDGADYVVWRKTNINGAAGYTTWRSNFGATGSGGNGGDPMSSSSGISRASRRWRIGSNIALGQAFNIGGSARSGISNHNQHRVSKHGYRRIRRDRPRLRQLRSP